MPESQRLDVAPIWPLPVLLATVLLIVIGPYLLLRAAEQEVAARSAAVSHTAVVGAEVQALMYHLRNRESAATAYGAGYDTPLVRARLSESKQELPRGLEKVAKLTRDNPDQQRRIGQLMAAAALREELVGRIIAVPPGKASPLDLRALASRHPIRELGKAIIDTEETLLEQRMLAAERERDRARALAFGAVIAQLLMLGLVVYFSRRQLAKRLEAELESRKAHARAQAVLQTVREPIVLVDGNLNVVMHNAAFAELYGVKDMVTQGQPLVELGGGAWKHPGTLQRLGDVLARGRELWDYEQVQTTADGVERTMLINARKMFLPDSDDQVALIIASDITAQKVAEVHVRELNRQLEGKIEQVSDVNRELEAFSYSVSHDLRAPLRHISGFADKLERHLGDRNDEKSRHYLGIISSSAKRMSQLIDDLLVYSRLGRSALRLQPVDLQSMVDEVRAMLDANVQQDAPEHRVEWHMAPLPIVVGDDNMLRQVWLNLLGNAVKYSMHAEPARIEVHYARQDDGTHRFEVRDNGVGFDMTYAGKLFGVFQRLHSDAEFQGTGIGLASVRRVLSRHGGRIWAESTPGQGSAFFFTLPPSNDTTLITEPRT
ncbi:sensor histidine kinase [Lysobacter olei]